MAVCATVAYALLDFLVEAARRLVRNAARGDALSRLDTVDFADTGGNTVLHFLDAVLLDQVLEELSHFVAVFATFSDRGFLALAYWATVEDTEGSLARAGDDGWAKACWEHVLAVVERLHAERSHAGGDVGLWGAGGLHLVHVLQYLLGAASLWLAALYDRLAVQLGAGDRYAGLLHGGGEPVAPFLRHEVADVLGNALGSARFDVADGEADVDYDPGVDFNECDGFLRLALGGLGALDLVGGVGVGLPRTLR